MVDFLTALLALSSIAVHGVAALQCIQCTSDPSAPNQDCIGNEKGTMALDVVSVYFTTRTTSPGHLLTYRPTLFRATQSMETSFVTP